MLKNVLSLLLSKFYSKKESALVAHQAMPNFENAVALSLTTGNDGTYVAPADGYINVEVESSGYVNFWGGILDSASNGLWNKVAVPVSKGRTVRYHIEGQVVYAAFINLVGGGYKALKNALLQGGAICLSNLCSSLRRSSWLARSLGSATSLKLSYQGARKSPLSLAPILKTTQRHATELYVSILLTLRGQSSALLLISGVAYFTARTKQEFIKCSRFLSQRVKRSTLASQRIKAPLISSSFRLLAPQLNVANGGASC